MSLYEVHIRSHVAASETAKKPLRCRASVGTIRLLPMINVAAIRMQQFGVQFYQASLTASDIDKLVRFEVLNYGDTAQPPVRGGKPQPGARAVEGELGPARAAHRVEREGLPAPDHPPQDRRARAVLRAVPAGARSAVDSRRRHHLVRREADVPAGGRRLARRHPEGARARRHSARDRRPAPAARAARRHRPLRRARTSACRRSSSTGCPRITSSRCS